MQLTTAELRKVPPHLYDQCAYMLFALLRRTDRIGPTAHNSNLKDEMTAEYEACIPLGTKSSRFQASIPGRNIQLKHEITINNVWMEVHPMVSVLDKRTLFQGAAFLISTSTGDDCSMFMELSTTLLFRLRTHHVRRPGECEHL